MIRCSYCSSHCYSVMCSWNHPIPSLENFISRNKGRGQSLDWGSRVLFRGSFLLSYHTSCCWPTMQSFPLPQSKRMRKKRQCGLWDRRYLSPLHRFPCFLNMEWANSQKFPLNASGEVKAPNWMSSTVWTKEVHLHMVRWCLTPTDIPVLPDPLLQTQMQHQGKCRGKPSYLRQTGTEGFTLIEVKSHFLMTGGIGTWVRKLHWL